MQYLWNGKLLNDIVCVCRLVEFYKVSTQFKWFVTTEIVHYPLFSKTEPKGNL